MIVEKNRHLIILKNLIDEENVTSEKLALLSFSSVRTIKSDLLYLKEILEKEKIVLIDDLCENLHLSRKTIADDLRKAEKFLASYDIKVESLPGKGTEEA